MGLRDIWALCFPRSLAFALSRLKKACASNLQPVAAKGDALVDVDRGLPDETTTRERKRSKTKRKWKKKKSPQAKALKRAHIIAGREEGVVAEGVIVARESHLPLLLLCGFFFLSFLFVL
jgi:hypothetical protein